MEIKKRSVWKWVLGILLLLSLISGMVVYYVANNFNSKVKPFLVEQLKKSVVAASDSLYHIEFSDLSLDMISGNARVSNFKLVPDSNVYKQMVLDQNAPDNVYTLSVEKLLITKLKSKKAYTDKQLEIGGIVINHPELKIVNKRQPYNEVVEKKKAKSPYDLVKDIFNVLHVKNISLKNIDFTFVDRNEIKEKKTALRNLNIDIEDVFIDSLSSRDTSRFYNTRNISLKLSNYQMATPDSLYYLNLDNITFSTSKREIIMKKLALQPRYNKVEFYKKVKYAKDRYDLSFNSISFKQIDLQRFLRSQELHVAAMRVSNAQVEVYNNNAYPKQVSVKRSKSFPHQKLQELAFNMKIDTLYINKTDITYAEADQTSKQIGSITFKNTHGILLNVTNNTEAKRVNPRMTASLKTRFMNTADLSVNFKFNLLATDGTFRYSGTLGTFDGRVLNRITRPLGMVEVESANVKKLSFDVKANEHIARGTLKFYYDDLKVQLLKREQGQNTLDKQKFISKLANTFVVRTSNPNAKGEFVSGSINYQKEPDATFFNFLWKALLDGIKPSVGVDKGTEKRINDVVSEVGSIIQIIKGGNSDNKVKREERRKARELKREQRKQNRQ